LFQLPAVSTVQYWSVDEASRKFREALEMRGVYFGRTPEHIQHEVECFERSEYCRAVMQVHVEQVVGLKPKERKEIYKRWREDLGDKTAREYAKFSEYVIQKGRPQWFNPLLTRHPQLMLQKPSCVLESLPVSCKRSVDRAFPAPLTLL